MRIALAQLNPLVGDLVGNAARLLQASAEAVIEAASGEPLLMVTPELSLWGYPARDLLLRPSLIALQNRLLDQLTSDLQRQAPQVSLLVGIAEPTGSRTVPNLYNALVLVEAGGWRVVYRKQLLPSYDVFDERRYFVAGLAPAVLQWPPAGGLRLGLTICEDLWVDADLAGQRLAGPDPIAELKDAGIDLLLNLSASPFGLGKLVLRRQLATRAAARLGAPVVYVNQVGGNDELVFDGASFLIQPDGALATQLTCCREEVVSLAWPPHGNATAQAVARLEPPDELEQLFRALVLGVADYARKCGFNQALLGLSGGIDSALVAVLAAAALGADQVTTLLLPSPWSSEGSISDATALAQRLGLATQILPIAPLMQAFDHSLAAVLGGAPSGLAAENLQSRIRGTLLMALANQQGQLLLATGNKSELAVGYCTLYGDMNGGLAVIGDLYKTTVFALCAWLDGQAACACRSELGLPPDGELIGAAIRHKPPSAELRPDQKDSDSLPDYAVLDPVLKALIEAHQSPEQLVADGVDPALAERVMGLLRSAEFKRRQAPPVLKVSRRAFGSGWRMPIAAR
ncbi:MAG: NAD+ synthase [Cyanobacteria bacterium REEB417]|nr:NAD+ synthase [Cyanobacteria bacterium REEB417]